MITKQNIIIEKSLQFSIHVIQYCESLIKEKKFVIADQLLKSATSIGANVHEAQEGESLADFLHKMKIALMEAKETVYWLQLCKLSEGYLYDEKYLKEVYELMNILSKIIITCKSKKKVN